MNSAETLKKARLVDIRKHKKRIVRTKCASERHLDTVEGKFYDRNSDDLGHFYQHSKSAVVTKLFLTFEF